MCTVQTMHIGGEEATEGDAEAALKELWEKVKADPRVVYACGQLERGKLGGLHGQCYVEFNTSLRNSQVRKILPSWATHMRTTRTKCRTYCRKASDAKSERVAALHDIGEWRPERGDSLPTGEPGPKARALDYVVKDGLEPADIARLDPECYFTFHHAIIALHKALNEWEG